MVAHPKFSAVLFDCDGVLVDSESITNGVLHLMQDTVRDALGVHEDAIAVEQNRGELRVRSHGPILPSATHAGSHRPDRDRTGPTGIAPVRSTDRTAVPTAGLTPARSSPPSTGRAPRRARRR